MFLSIDTWAQRMHMSGCMFYSIPYVYVIALDSYEVIAEDYYYDQMGFKSFKLDSLPAGSYLVQVEMEWA